MFNTEDYENDESIASNDEVSESDESNGSTEEIETIDLDNCRLDFSDSYIQGNYPEHIPTGFKKLDDLLGGGISPGLTVLGAISSLGKSTFYLQLAQNIAAQGIPVLYYSLEMPKHAIVLKSLFRSAFKDLKNKKYPSKNINKTISRDAYNDLKKKMLTNSDLLKASEDLSANKLKMKNDAMDECQRECENLTVIERNNEIDDFSAANIRRQVEWFMKKNSDKPKPVVFVDYLQILISQTDKYGKTYKSDKQIVDENIKTLWSIANNNQIPLMVISSVNRESYYKPITFSSFKESGGIEFTADVVLGMQFSAIRKDLKNFDPDREKSHSMRGVEVIVLKQRYGKCGSEAYDSLIYYPEFSYFEEGNIENFEKLNVDKPSDEKSSTEKPKAEKLNVQKTNDTATESTEKTVDKDTVIKKTMTLTIDPGKKIKRI